MGGVSYMLSLDEYDEKHLREELRLRENRRLLGLCDYCERAPEEPPCRFPKRHAMPDQKERGA